MSDVIRWFIGCDGGDCDLESMMVAESSARRRCSMPIEITWMRQSKSGFYSGWKTASARTPFSHYRWSLPAACDFAGRALYTDVDFVVLGDLAELWTQPIPNVVAMKTTEGKLKTCTMLIDCAKAKGHFWVLDRLRAHPDVNDAMTHYLRTHRELLSAFDGEWNSIDLVKPTTKALHYSRIETQPSLRYAVPRLQREGKRHWYTGEVRTHWDPAVIDAFEREYKAALEAGYTLDQYRASAPVEAVRKNFRYTAHRGSELVH